MSINYEDTLSLVNALAHQDDKDNDERRESGEERMGKGVSRCRLMDFHRKCSMSGDTVASSASSSSSWHCEQTNLGVLNTRRYLFDS